MRIGLGAMAVITMLTFTHSGTAQASTCPAIALAEPAGERHCAQSASGIAIAASPDRAKRLLVYGDEASRRFAKTFKRKAARFAIVEIGAASLSSQMRDALRKSGYPVVLPWLSPQAYRDQALASIRRGLEGRLAGLSEEARLPALKTAEAQVERQFSNSATNERDATAIPHELGHMWLIEAFWTVPEDAPGGHYGGPGPDWLDEMAAVVLEPESSAERRRTQFAERYRKHSASGGSSTDTLLDLADYFGKSHPVGEQARNLTAPQSTSEGVQVRVLSGEEAQRFAGDGIRFYLQSRVLADYLLERSGNPALLGEIAAFVARGGTFASWLDRSGRKNGLARDLTGFKADWLAWLANRYPPNG